MQPFDVFVLILLVLMTVFGGMKGMAWQIAQFASFGVSWIVALRLSPSLAPMIAAEEPWNRIVAMLILFVVTSLGVWVVFRFVSKIIERVKLKEFDRQMGAMLGLINGMLVVMVITFFGVMLSERTRGLVLNSHCGFYSAKMVQHVVPLLPEDVRTTMAKAIENFNAEVDAQEDAPPPIFPKKSDEETLANEATPSESPEPGAPAPGANENADENTDQAGDETENLLDSFRNELREGAMDVLRDTISGQGDPSSSGTAPSSGNLLPPAPTNPWNYSESRRDEYESVWE